MKHQKSAFDLSLGNGFHWELFKRLDFEFEKNCFDNPKTEFFPVRGIKSVDVSLFFFVFSLTIMYLFSYRRKKNFITNLFTWCSFEFIISFMLSGDDFLSRSGIMRLIWLINACLSVLSICYNERGNESHLLPDLSYIMDIIYFLLANVRFGIGHVQS